jgi:glycosyltransferase involved in cell wall biosynthesis
MMRIGLGATVLTKGMVSGRIDGIGVYTRSLLQELDKLDLEKTVVNFGSCKTFSNHSFFPGHSKVCLPLPYQAAAAFSYFSSLPFPGSKQLINQIDLFHAPDHYIPRLSKIPVVATILDAIPLVHPEWVSKGLRTFRMMFRNTARSAEQIITISEYSKADIAHYFGIPPERISVTYLGVNPIYSQPVAPEIRRAVLQRHGLEPGFFLFVGSIQPRKNVTRIIEAHRMLPMQTQKSCPMVIVGRRGGGSEDILPELHALQARGCGRWLNDVTDEELHALLQSARALVYPSLYEGFGLPVLEGFAAGLPVISSNTTSIPEVAADAAMLVDPERTEEIAAAMQRLAEDDALAADLAERGRKRVKEFSWAACARQTLDVYRNLAG